MPTTPDQARENVQKYYDPDDLYRIISVAVEHLRKTKNDLEDTIIRSERFGDRDENGVAYGLKKRQEQLDDVTRRLKVATNLAVVLKHNNAWTDYPISEIECLSAVIP